LRYDSVCPGRQVVRWYRGSVEYALIRCGSLLIVVCDVSGKGLDAALLVAALLGGLSIDPEREPFVLLRDLNNAVCGHTGGCLITACCARLYQIGQLVAATSGLLLDYSFEFYVGEADLSVAPERVEQCFSQTAWKRLKSLKRKYDPANAFFSYLTT
jgi:hypothetical protein